MIFAFIAGPIASQDKVGGYHIGTKAGLSLGNQNWNGGERNALFSYHANVFIETRDPEYKGSLYAQCGLHSRGSNIGFRGLIGNSRNAYKFRNISLTLGAKKVLDNEIMGARPYYFLGIRGEYTLKHNMEEIQRIYLEILNDQTQQINTTLPSFVTAEPAFVNDFVYGISMGGGFQFYGSEYFNTALEFTLSPDLNFQYNRLPGQAGSTEALQIRNVTFEISVVFRFLREIIYED